MKMTRWMICAVAMCVLAVTASATETVDFTIDSGKVVPSTSFAAKVSVLGAAITSRGNDMPVTLQVQIGDAVLEPWGAMDDVASGDVNVHAPAMHYVYRQQLPADTAITITGCSWNTSGTSTHMEVNSHTQSSQVRVLRDGDDVPNLAGYDGQASAASFVEAYISDGKISLDVNQAIYLFELGTTNVSSSATDFQDLVVLVTLGETVDDLLPPLIATYD